MTTGKTGTGTKKRPVRTWIIGAGAALLVIGSVLLMCLLSSWKVFFRLSYRERELPGGSSGFVPQGVEIVEDSILISGYMDKNHAGRLYRLDEEGRWRRIDLMWQDGEPLLIHAGGVCAEGGMIYVAGGDGYCYVFSEETVFSQSSARALGRFRTYNKSSFCTAWDGKIYVGEYYRKGRFNTDDDHHINTFEEHMNSSVIFSFPVVEGAPLGIDETPDGAYSMGGGIQGACIIPGNVLAISVSARLADSQILFYDLDMVYEREPETFTKEGMELPLYQIDFRSLVDTMDVLPKSEGITYEYGRIYVVFESAARRYTYGKFLGAGYVYSFPVV